MREIISTTYVNIRTYGALGAPTCVYYNIYVAEAITRQGRSYISCSIMLFESFLANNVKFNSLNEVITFIKNVVDEKNERKFDDKLILDRDIYVEEAFFKIMNTADPMVWVPTKKEMGLVWDYISGLSQEDINRLYYKNNLYSFADLPLVTNLLLDILCKLDKPFMDPNKPPKIIKDDLNKLYELMYEYVYYHHFYIDKLDRIEYMQRDIVAICDTDSTIISMDAWYRFMLNKTYDVDMPIKHKMIDMVSIINEDEFGDKVDPRIMCEIVEPEFDYDFYTDEVIETECKINMCKIIPQESLKYSIINTLSYVCGKLVNDYLEQYSKLTFSYAEGKVCETTMKNEFTFLRALLTSHRRNYADLQSVQEGNIIPEKERLAIMGLAINKSTLSESTKAAFQRILLEDIFNSTDIDQITIMKKLIIIEKEIFNNIMAGKLDYYKPDNVGTISSYDNPLSTNGVIAIMVYNALRDPDMPMINLDERNKIIKVKLDIDKNSALKIKDEYPEQYERIIRLLDHPTLGKKVNTIGFPLDTDIPKWVLKFVDYKAIINDNLKNFPLESIGLMRLDNDTVNVSNIIQL